MNKYKTIIYDVDGTILNTLDMNMYPSLRIIPLKQIADEEARF